MYSHLQETVRRHIIEALGQISGGWTFDIDINAKDDPIIVGYGPDGLVIRGPIEKFHLYAPIELLDDIATLHNMSNSYIMDFGGCILLRSLLNNVFSIYGIDIIYDEYLPVNFKVGNKSKTRWICSNMWNVIQFEKNSSNFICPFLGVTYKEYIMKETLISPFLLLLDPISYFRRYSIIIKKYKLNNAHYHTFGIYEILLNYFPEMNKELFSRYCILWCVFQDMCTDIIVVISRILIELYDDAHMIV